MALTKSERSLFNAVKNGNMKQLKTALKKVNDVDFEGDFGRTPLEQAIFDGSQPMVKALLEAGASINRINDLDQTPLDFAKSQKETKIATFLKDEGALKKSEVTAQNNRFGNYYDDDFSGSSFDDDDVWGDGGIRKTTRKSSRSSAKQAVRKSASGGSESAATAKPEKADQPVQPKFTEETLKDVFNAKAWIGKTEEMQKLWDDVPAKLQKKYDFDSALAEAKRETLRKNAPTAPKLNMAPVNQGAKNNEHPAAQPPKSTPPANA